MLNAPTRLLFTVAEFLKRESKVVEPVKSTDTPTIFPVELVAMIVGLLDDLYAVGPRIRWSNVNLSGPFDFLFSLVYTRKISQI